MRIPFYKYQATANDFVIINQILVPYLKEPDTAWIRQWCDRRLGVGADGLMIIERSSTADFKMTYYNADGRLSTMCGNGGRAMAHLAYNLNIAKDSMVFEAIDGLHEAHVKGDIVQLKMMDCQVGTTDGDAYILDTGSPHFVHFVADLDRIAMVDKAQKIRYNDTYREEGINVNFVEPKGSILHVRTYERGVEDETYSCGTGVTAAAIASVLRDGLKDGSHRIDVSTLGGNLQVRFDKVGQRFQNIWLIGQAIKVFEGSIMLPEDV